MKSESKKDGIKHIVHQNSDCFIDKGILMKICFGCTINNTDGKGLNNKINGKKLRVQCPSPRGIFACICSVFAINMKKYKTFLFVTPLVLLLSSCLPEGSVDSGPITLKPPDERITSPVTGTQRLPETSKEPEIITKKATFIGCGDNITYYGNTREAKSLSTQASGEGRTYNFKPTYSEVASIIENADIAFINQENVMSASKAISYYPHFNCPTDMGYDLKELGFDVVNIATNHMLDAGSDALDETIDFLEGLGFTLIGGYKNQESAYKIRTFEANGIKIAFLAYTYSTNGLKLWGNSEIIIPYLDKDLAEKQFEKAREEADFLIVSAHWGDENSFSPNAQQREYAQLFADLGADVIIGHHPHVIQPIEWLSGKEGNKTLCVYSLGNFVAEMPKDYNICGGIISFEIVQTGDEKPYVNADSVLFTPTIYNFSSTFYNNKVYLLENYTDNEAKSHGISYYGNYTSLEKLKKYYFDTISKEFLPSYLEN